MIGKVFHIHPRHKATIALAFFAVIMLLIVPAMAQLFPDRAVVVNSNVFDVNATVNWGLSFPQEGRAPIGNATPDALAKHDAYFVGKNSMDKVLYLTFDAGYENGNTVPILDALKKHNAKAAFFLVGHYIEKNPELLKRMSEEGHTIGNHTYSHPDMSAISDPTTFAKELSKLEDAYRTATGQSLPKFYRPPQGKYNADNLKQAQALGYRTVFWSLAYVDWQVDKQPTSEQAFSKLIPRIHPGAVVLLHSTSVTNAQIMDELLTRWEALGYRFGTLDELVA